MRFFEITPSKNLMNLTPQLSTAIALARSLTLGRKSSCALSALSTAARVMATKHLNLHLSQWLVPHDSTLSINHHHHRQRLPALHVEPVPALRLGPSPELPPPPAPRVQRLGSLGQAGHQVAPQRPGWGPVWILSDLDDWNG